MSDELQRAVGRVEGKVDMILEKIGSMEEKQDHTDNEVMSLRLSRSFFYGITATISALSSAVGVYVGKFFFHVSH